MIDSITRKPPTAAAILTKKYISTELLKTKRATIKNKIIISNVIF